MMREKECDGSDEHLLENGGRNLPLRRRRKCSIASESSFTEFIVLFLSGAGLFIIGCVTGRSWPQKMNTISTDRPGSGILWRSGESLGQLDWTYTRFQGSTHLQPGDKYRGAPGPDIDAAWERFSRGKWVFSAAAVLNVSEQEVHRSMNDARIDMTVKLAESNGGGYMGTLELFHQMHCLDILRKWTYLEHYKEADEFFHTKNNHLREHTDHCIDMIRQSLMCNGDIGLVLFDWIKDKKLPAPDFYTMHQCRDPEQILAWAIANSAPITETIQRIGGEEELEEFL